MTLNEVMTQTADAIREKTGKSEKIAPINFAEEIKSISAGEGESGDDWHYFDVSGLEGQSKHQSLQLAMTYKVRGENIESLIGMAGVVMPAGFGSVIPTKTEEIKAIGMDYSTEVRMGAQSGTIGQSVTTAPWYGQAPEITKEQFYTLE